MKKLFLLIITVFVLSSCQRTISDPTHENNDEPDAALYDGKMMMVVKFGDSEQVNNVILGHQIIGYFYGDSALAYIEDSGLSLNIQRPSSNPMDNLNSCSIGFVNFLDTLLHIRNHSPFIPLANDYYLVEWRWTELLPLSVRLDYLTKEDVNDRISNHLFITDIPWSELDNLTQIWDNAQYTDHVDITEVWLVKYKAIDVYFKEIKTTYPFLFFNWTLYSGGLSASAIFQYYVYRDNPGLYSPDAYMDFIAYCDNLQNAYKLHLIDLIQSGKLNNVGY